MADNSRCTECEGVMKGNDIKCVQRSLCQDLVHLECFVMAAGMDEALFQRTKVDPTKKKKVEMSHLSLVGLWIWIPPLSPGGRRTYDLCGTCKRTMDNEVPGIMY